jgi:hypothetical protein
MAESTTAEVEYLAPSDKWNGLAKQGEAPTDEQKKRKTP